MRWGRAAFRIDQTSAEIGFRSIGLYDGFSRRSSNTPLRGRKVAVRKIKKRRALLEHAAVEKAGGRAAVIG